MTSTTILARKILPDDVVERVDAAQLLTDACVGGALKLLADECRSMSLTGHVISDAHLLASSIMYDRAAETLRAVASGSSYQRYAQDTDCVLARVLVADQLAARVGCTLDMAVLLGHLRSPMSRNEELTEALDRAADCAS